MATTRASLNPISILIIFMTICALNEASVTTAKREGHVTRNEETSENHKSSRPSIHSSPNSLIFDDEDIATMTKKKISHRLMGGHVRYETTTVSSLIRNSERSETANSDDSDETDEAEWDDGFIVSSAGNGKERITGKNKSSKNDEDDDDDEKKTLSQQVKEGKYGLIQNEIYSSRPKRPGIISYLSNPEVPRDNARNLGGLDEEEIWLAENHLLVLRGGKFPEDEKEREQSGENPLAWSPIDDYTAPKRQVRIPARPKIPPPFPVQLIENGPVRYIGTNETANNRENEKTTKSYGNVTTELTSKEHSTRTIIDDPQSPKTKLGHVPSRNDGIIGPFYPALPAGAVFVVPPRNNSDYDEDDQSIYYPPPYSFHYKQDNSTPVPPGPLVPGIILPPPPDFFAPIEENDEPATRNVTVSYAKRPSTPTAPRASQTYKRPGNSSAKQSYKATATPGTVAKTTTIKYTSRGASSFTMKPVSLMKYKTTTGRTYEKSTRVREKNTPSLLDATTASIDSATNREIAEFTRFKAASPEPNSVADETTRDSTTRWIPSFSARPVPLVTYYSTSTPSSIDETIEATPAYANSVLTTGKQRGTTNHASYYFYEETSEDPSVVTTTSVPANRYRATTETPYRGIRPVSREQSKQQHREEEKKSYYEAEIAAIQRTPKAYAPESRKTVTKTSKRFDHGNSVSTTNSVIPATRANEQQRIIVESSVPYYADTTDSPREQFQGYHTTTETPIFSRQSPNEERYDYDRGTKPEPIYQYSYVSSDYLKREQQQQQQRQENYYEPVRDEKSYYGEAGASRSTLRPETFDEWQDIRVDDGQRYDYVDKLPELEPEREKNTRYDENEFSYETTTARPINVPTANPREAYYTRQEEQLLDDVTREYFTNFGKKLRDESTTVTTPIYEKTRIATARPVYTEIAGPYGSGDDYENLRQVYRGPRVRVHYGDQSQRPYSLNDDTRVNYKDPLPAIEPESEWIPGYSPESPKNPQLQNYQQLHRAQTINNEYDQRNLPVADFSRIRNYGGQGIIEGTNDSPTNFVPIGDSRDEARRNYASTRPVSLDGDTDVNYREPRPPINPDAEYIDPSIIQGNGNKNLDKASYFAYRLPGDGGHFYFLTPRAISPRQDVNGGYVYPRARGRSFTRQRRRDSRNS